MTAVLPHIGDHIHPFNHPAVDLEVVHLTDDVEGATGHVIVEGVDTAGQLWTLIEDEGEPCGLLLRVAADHLKGAAADVLTRAAEDHEANGCAARLHGKDCAYEDVARSVLWGA